MEVLIDLREAGLDLDPEELETYSLRLAEELRDGLFPQLLEVLIVLKQRQSPSLLYLEKLGDRF